MMKMVGNIPTVNTKTYPYIIAPANLSRDAWRQAYARIFKGAKGWRIGVSAKGVKDKGVKDKVENGARGGKIKPTVAVSVEQKMESDGVPKTFKAKERTNFFYLTRKRWFVEYHYPMLEDRFGTSNENELTRNNEFLTLLTELINRPAHNYKRRLKHDDQANTHVDTVVATLKAQGRAG